MIALGPITCPTALFLLLLLLLLLLLFFSYRVSNNMRDFSLTHDPPVRRLLDLITLNVVRRPPLCIADQFHLIAPRRTVDHRKVTLRPGRAERERACIVRFACVAASGRRLVVEICFPTSGRRTVAHGALEVPELGDESWEAGAD
jgi:hypothetical protein